MEGSARVCLERRHVESKLKVSYCQTLVWPWPEWPGCLPRPLQRRTNVERCAYNVRTQPRLCSLAMRHCSDTTTDHREFCSDKYMKWSEKVRCPTIISSSDCVHLIHAKMFSIQMLLHFCQIVPRVCTLVLFIPLVRPLANGQIYYYSCSILVYCIALYYILLYCIVLYCSVLYCTLLYFIVLYCTVLYLTVLYYTLLYCTLLYYTALYCTILHCTVLYFTVLYCTLLYSAVFCIVW